MEFQNENENNDNNFNNNPDEKLYECDCGCGLSFQEGNGLGFRIMVGPDDVIQESKLCGMDWNDYIPAGPSDTWGELMELFENMARDHPNDRVWAHLEAYVERRRDFDERTWLDYVYVN